LPGLAKLIEMESWLTKSDSGVPADAPPNGVLVGSLGLRPIAVSISSGKPSPSLSTLEMLTPLPVTMIESVCVAVPAKFDAVTITGNVPEVVGVPLIVFPENIKPSGSAEVLIEIGAVPSTLIGKLNATPAGPEATARLENIGEVGAVMTTCTLPVVVPPNPSLAITLTWKVPAAE